MCRSARLSLQVSRICVGARNIKYLKFDIRFHLHPDVKIMKTQDEKSILVELENSGWKVHAVGRP